MDVPAILREMGEAVYEWTIADDRLAWSSGAEDLLGGRITSGREYAALVDASSAKTRHDAIFNSSATDRGGGVPYEIQYAIHPDGRTGSRRLVIDDVGRWYASASGAPAKARGIVRVVNERYELQQRLAFLSRYDELTGFFSREHLLTTVDGALASAQRTQTSIAFLIVAIDNFGAINDAYGSETGDQVLAVVAQRIKGQLRAADAIGRYSGGKIGILLMACNEADMVAASERFHDAVRGDVVATATSSVAVTVSIGGVVLPRHGKTVHDAIARAQEGLRQARGLGYGRFVAYSASSSREEWRRQNAALSSELVAALGNGRLKLFLQPIVHVETRTAVFYEALLRLQREDGTLAHANDFIDLCERLGLVRLIDRFALDRTLDALEATPEVQISINVSAETIADADWLSRLADAMAQRRDLGRRLIVEITESAVIRNIDEAGRFIAIVHDLGGRVAIDDFGAGYSSFRHLRSLAVDIVKIDGSYVQRLSRSTDDQAFVRALSALAGALDIDIVAEWVEDEESAALLKGYGVKLLQGILTGEAEPHMSARAPSPTAREAG